MGTDNVSMDSILDAVQEMKRQQKTVWQRLNSLTLVENSKQTIRRLENLEEHVQNLETQCDNNSTKLTDINLLVHSLLEVVNKFVVAVENLQDNRTSEKTKNLLDTTDKRNNKNRNHSTTTCLTNISVPVRKDSDETENSRNAKFDQPIYNMNSEHTIKPDICKTMCPYKTDLSIDVYNVSICNDFSRRTHKDDSKYITDAEEHRCTCDDNGQFACKEEDNVPNKDRSIHTTHTVQLSKNSMNCTKPNKRCTINKFGYKCKSWNIQNDNRMSFHGTSPRFEGNDFPSSTFQVPVECSPVPNIKQTENFSLETKRRFMSLKSDSTVKDCEDECELINLPQMSTRCTKNDFGYKTTRSDIQYDNRVSFHGSLACFEGCIISSSTIEVPEEYSPVPNIEQPFIHHTKPNVVPSESFSRPWSETDFLTDAERNGNDDTKQPRTIRDWLGHLQQVLEYSRCRQIAGKRRQGRGRHITLVLDISERMKGRKFEAMKTAAVQYIEGTKQHAIVGLGDNIGLAVFGGQSQLIQETTNDYSLILEQIAQLQPQGNAPILGGLIMGLAGVLSGPLDRIGDNPLQGHMIIFTDGTSGRVFPDFDTDVGMSRPFVFGNFRGRPETHSVLEMIGSTQTKIYYVPVGDDINNPTLEEAVRQTHGKVIQTSEMHRLIRMTQVMAVASHIASEIRNFPSKQTRDVIKRKIREASSQDDPHDDCLDMVMDFINPLSHENEKGMFLELNLSTLQLGDRVRRGPDWSFGDQDRNLPGTVVGLNGGGTIWVEWDHGDKNVYAYDEQRHHYKIMKVNEPRKLVDGIIAVGCRVVRGQDWKFDDTDGGPGSIGTVLDVRREGNVVVRWDCKRTCLYKMGCKGRFEIRLQGDNAQTSRQNRNRMPRRRHARRLSMSDEEEEYVSSTKHASDYVIPIYSDSTVSAIWEYKDGSYWKEYPDDINVKIERAYQRKQRKTIIEMDRTTFEVHFSEMEQENPKNKTKVTVRRRD
ncbi:uncharacterized protein LOC127734540 isoform X1 [Mytilus californianus]|uniref:uncharacterized protein LOC127734540 isoform X1 n=1 Tax=Mytilus californianus TaxID=6549 RepID=UPI002245534C|nr:uncharacterized protein LOC127734540 isoform X1 [Mytilus californianus]